MTNMTPDDFAAVYAQFEAPVSRFDCGRKCAPLNDGSPVCCSTQSAVPVVDKAEFQLLRSRSDLWSRFKPYDRATRKIVDELATSCCAIECKGARFCERQNRTIACRSFPFFPYITREKAFIGLSVYWTFEDRCWMISQMELVEQRFINEFATAFRQIFQKDKVEFETFVDFSASMRRVFTRQRRKLPILALDGRLLIVEPGNPRPRTGRAGEYPKWGPFKSAASYSRAIREAKGEVPAEGLAPV
jgi:hypothetical protein